MRFSAAKYSFRSNQLLIDEAGHEGQKACPVDVPNGIDRACANGLRTYHRRDSCLPRRACILAIRGHADIDLINQRQVFVAFGVLDFIDADSVDRA
jgi:hypothetical protein